MPSTLIKYFNYDPDKQMLTIEFVAGAVYEYRQVPAELYEQMKSAFAKGIFFNNYIRDIFPFNKRHNN